MRPCVSSLFQDPICHPGPNYRASATLHLPASLIVHVHAHVHQLTRGLLPTLQGHEAYASVKQLSNLLYLSDGVACSEMQIKLHDKPIFWEVPNLPYFPLRCLPGMLPHLMHG